MESMPSPDSNESLSDEMRQTITLPAAGNHDPEAQLCPEDVIALKERLNQSFDLVPQVCTYIVMNMLLESEAKALQQKEEVEERGGSFVSTAIYETREDFAEHVGMLSAHWAQHLQRAISLPGAEWPEGSTTLVTFSEAIDDMEREQEEARMAPDLARWLCDKYEIKISGLEPDSPLIETDFGLGDEEEDRLFEELGMTSRESDPANEAVKSLNSFGQLVLEECNIILKERATT